MISRRTHKRSSADASVARSEGFERETLSYVNHLYAASLRLTRNPSDAEDLVQETFLKALRFADRFEPGTNLKAWLFTILHNTFRNNRRDAGREPVDVNSEVVERAETRSPSSDDPEQLLLRSIRAADLRAAIDSLPEAFRQAVWLRDVEEFSYAEIADMVDVRIGTVMSRISRGRRLLYERLAPSSEVAGDGPSAG